MPGQIASLGGMYGADSGSSSKVTSLSSPMPAGLSTAGMATMSPAAVAPTATPVASIQLLPASLAGKSVFGQPLSWWAAVAVMLIVLKWAAERSGEGADFKNIRIGGFNFVVITIVSILGITIAKMIFGKYRVAALSDLVLAA